MSIDNRILCESCQTVLPVPETADENCPYCDAPLKRGYHMKASGPPSLDVFTRNFEMARQKGALE